VAKVTATRITYIQTYILFGGMVAFNYDFIPWKISFKINFGKTQVNSYANLGPQGHQKGQKNQYATL
jgi:hypothetical protein